MIILPEEARVLRTLQILKQTANSHNTSGYQSLSRSTTSLEQAYPPHLGQQKAQPHGLYSSDSTYSNEAGFQEGRWSSDRVPLGLGGSGRGAAVFGAGGDAYLNQCFDLRHRVLDFDMKRCMGFKAMERPPINSEIRTTNGKRMGLELNPLDSTNGLGAKMVEYVLGDSSTNKEGPLSGLEPRLRALKFDDSDKSHDDKEKANSPFETNGLKKDDQVTDTNGAVFNEIDEDKGFNRTPGSCQPKPAEESLAWPHLLLNPSQHGLPPHLLHHMIGSMDHKHGPGPQINSYPHHQMPPMSQLQPQVMNGIGGNQMSQNPMMKHQDQHLNQIGSPANLLQQQQPNFDVQQLFSSQNPALAAASNAADSPFDANGLKKDNQVNDTNGAAFNEIDEDKGFDPTPGSCQPSTAEESLPRRPHNLLVPSQHGFPPHLLHHMTGYMDHKHGPGTQINSYPHHQMPPMSQLQPQVLNGIGSIQISQNAMINHQGQRPNQIASPANLLQQQQPIFDVQQLFRSQNPALAAASNTADFPFDTNGLKKDDQVTVTNGAVFNEIDENKAFNRTPGSRQPSPAEESLPRPHTLLDSSQHGFPPHPLHHMIGSMDHKHVPGPQINSYTHHQMAQMSQLQPQVLNGIGGIEMSHNPMMNHQGQRPNQIGSPANFFQQQQPNFDVEQIFRSQNPALAAASNAAAVAAVTAAATSGATGHTNGTKMQAQPMPMPSQQLLAAQQNAYAAQQAAQYVINPGQDATPHMGLIAAQMPQFYGVAPWGMYPGNLILQQGSQPRRPLTPFQQGDANQSYQVIPPFFDQTGSLLMGPRTTTPMRLVSPAPVLVPPGASRGGTAPQQGLPQLYSPQPQAAQQNLHPQQNGSNVGGGGLFEPQALSGGLGTLGSTAQLTGLVWNTSSMTTRRDYFDQNTSVFGPSMDYSKSNATALASKWPVGGSVGNVLASPIGAPITSQPESCLIANQAPGAESKYGNQILVGIAGQNMFGSNSSLLSKHLGIPGPTSVAAAATNAESAARQSTAMAADGVNGERPPGRSRLLEEFRNQRYPNLQLRDLTNHIVEFSQDQHGSRFIQQKLERVTAAEKQMVFNEILGAAYSLMTDVFGNYVIQKFFEFGTPEQKNTLGMQVKGHVLQLALQMYGCRVIQKALESITPDQQQEIVRELVGHVLKCVKDQNGNHVVQKCIECVEPSALQFIINAFKSQVYSLSTHPYGCRVIQRILEHCTTKQTSPILEELHEYTEQLIQDQYGNYVLQHVLEHGKPEDKSILINSVRGKVLVLSQHKFASNVVEKCVTHATRSERTELIDEVCTFNDNALHVMMKDQYANYVVQKMIDVSEPTQLKKLMSKIRPHTTALRKYTYGKHINVKLEKFFMKSSNPIQPATALITTSTAVPSNAMTAIAVTANSSATPSVSSVMPSSDSSTTSFVSVAVAGFSSVSGLGSMGAPTIATDNGDL